MIYKTASDWLEAPRKRLMLYGMSGLGKTYLSEMLRAQAGWFHYSVDYRIGTRYMGEHIVDNFKREAMRSPLLADLLRSDSIFISSNLRFTDLSPLSTYLGKPGDPSLGGIPFEDYVTRQRQHHAGEVAAMLDTSHFIDRASDIYGIDQFVCDTSGSLVEVVDGSDAADPVLSEIDKKMLIVWIEGEDAHADILAKRFDANPKPMYYREPFLRECWARYLDEKAVAADKVDPDDFIRWGYRALLADRMPRYRAIAKNWGVTIKASDVSNITNIADFDALIADAVEAKGKAP